LGGIRLQGTESLRRLTSKLRKLQHIDLKGVNLSIAESLRTSTRERFKEQKEPSGKDWRYSIRATERGGVTLTDTARLKNSIRSSADKSGLAVGTNTIYAGTHQFGAKYTIRAKSGKGLRFKVGGKWVRKKEVEVNIPARPFLGINDDDMKEIKGTISDAFREAYFRS